MSLKPAAAHRKDLTAGLAPMEHRHFATVAYIIRNMRNSPLHLANIDVDEIAGRFALELAGTNPNFNRTRFLKACGVEID